MKLTGKVWKYADDVNTDVIFPGRYTYAMMSDEEMGSHALEDLDADFCKTARPGDIIVAGKNWGCGSSREQAVKCLKARGIKVIIAKGFARIFYRNALNEGLATIVCAQAADAVKAGDAISVDFSKNTVTTPAGEFSFPAYPDFVKGLIEDGGLIPHVQKSLKKQGA